MSKPANIFLKYWIVLLSMLAFAAIVFPIIFSSYLGLDMKRLMKKRYLLWAKRLLNIVKAKVIVEGKENLQGIQQDNIIIMSNHVSLYDIPLIVVAYNGNVRMLAKKELLEVPLWGKAMRETDFIGVDRSDSRKARQSMELLQKKMKEGIVYWIAPEGDSFQDR